MNPPDQDGLLLADSTINARISTSLVAHCACPTDLHPHTVAGRTVWRRCAGAGRLGRRSARRARC